MVLTGNLHAQGAPDLQGLYEQAKADLMAGRATEALGKFKQCLGLAGGDEVLTWQMQLGVARSYEKLDDALDALDYYHRFLDSFLDREGPLDSVWEKRRLMVQDQVVPGLEAGVLATRGLYTVQSTPPGAQVSIDGSRAGADQDAVTPFSAYLPSGPHNLVLSLEGHRRAEVRVVVRVGGRERVVVPLAKEEVKAAPVVEEIETTLTAMPGEPGGEPVAAAAAPEPGAQPAPPAAPTALVERSRDGLPPVWGWVGVGLGGALLAGGVISVVLAKQANDDLNYLATHAAEYTPGKWNNAKDRQMEAQAGAIACFVSGGVAAAGGAAYLVFFARRGAPPKAAVQLLPVPGGGVLGVSGSW
jgi:hypothetical protein